MRVFVFCVCWGGGTFIGKEYLLSFASLSSQRLNLEIAEFMHESRIRFQVPQPLPLPPHTHARTHTHTLARTIHTAHLTWPNFAQALELTCHRNQLNAEEIQAPDPARVVSVVVGEVWAPRVEKTP